MSMHLSMSAGGETGQIQSMPGPPGHTQQGMYAQGSVGIGSAGGATGAPASGNGMGM